ncbi:MAG: DMT family transporter [Acidobacteriia bacterium]|nr:DMT family transporter [Terriglobia bacterium]
MSRDRSGSLPAAVALAVAVGAVSWASILVRLSDAPSLGIAFYRLLFSVALLLPWALSRSAPVSARTYGLAAAAGVLLALHFATWITSLRFTSIASSVVIVTTQPAFTAALGPYFLRERPGGRGIAAMVLALSGTAVLAGGDLAVGGRALWGDLLALAGAVTASAYFMIGRRVRERIGFPRYLLLVNSVSAATLLGLAWAGGARLTGYPSATWGWLLLLAAGPHLTGHGLLNWSVRRLPAFTVNMAILGEPVLATVYAAVLFREIPGPAFYGGAILIVAGIVLAASEGRPVPADPSL